MSRILATVFSVGEVTSPCATSLYVVLSDALYSMQQAATWHTGGGTLLLI